MILWRFCVIFVLINCVLCHVSQKRSHFTHTGNTENDSIIGAAGPENRPCSQAPFCVPYVQCPAHLSEESAVGCLTVARRLGMCCTTGQNHTGPDTEKKIRTHSLHKIDPITLHYVARHARNEVAELRIRETTLLHAGHTVVLVPGSASYGHFRNSRVFNFADLNRVTGAAFRALQLALATRAFKDRQGLTNHQIELGMIREDLRPTLLGESCSPKPICPAVPDRHRRIDGACNNVNNPNWGSAMTPYSRLSPPSYYDGIWVPRFSQDGRPLTSPRKISTTLFSEENVPEHGHTLMVMQFGQYLSHDTTQSLDFTFGNGSAISCCGEEGARLLQHNERHYACMPIEIPFDDPFYSVFGQGCMNFVRSFLAPREDCTLGYAEQMNKITHFIDGSSVYGSSPEQTAELRSFDSGRLNVFRDFGRDLLPLAKDPDACSSMEQACFTAGDTRSNQMISLVVLHTIFVREHNRIAEELFQINPHWDDERIFAESRRIVTAELQVIVYKEFLPAVIGDLAVEEFRLNLGKEAEYAFDYDPSVNPSITNEFAAAALRFGHSTVDGLLKLYGSKYIEEMISIPEVMFQPGRIRKRLFLDEVLNTLTSQPLQQVDHFMADALTKYMFRSGNPFGVDLASLNIQRGRDHGLRPYNDYRELVGQPRLKNFEEFNPELIEKLKTVYTSVDDIDLWVGGLLEPKATGSIVGYTFRDIIADQFFRLKKGDRYFFENDPTVNPGYFTPEQLFELRKTSMSRIICDNSDGILLARQAPNAFRKPGVPGNDFFDCSGPEIPRVNLIYWRE